MKRSTLKELSKKLEKLTLRRIQSETEEIIKKDKRILQRKEAEFKTGSRPDGGIIGLYRSESYKLYKLSKNPIAGGTVDLILTGSTVRHLQVVSLGSGAFKLESTDTKWPMLMEKYGDINTVINKEYFDGLQKSEYAPKLIERLRDIIR